MTRHVPTCHPGMNAYLTAKYWGEQLSCPLFPFQHGWVLLWYLHSLINLEIFLWINSDTVVLNHSSSVVYLVPICDNINRADFRWNANVQSKLGVQRVDDHIGGIHRITVLRLPPNCILYYLLKIICEL